MTTRRNQVFIGFKCSPEFRSEMERAAGNGVLSQLIRDAVIEKLKREGYKVADALGEAPSRVGKGGRKKQPEQTLRTSDSTPAPDYVAVARQAVTYSPKKNKPRKTRP